MPSLADLYSMIGSAKRRATDTIANPGLSLAQMVGNANDQARNLNEQTAAAAQEGIEYGPASRKLAQHMAEAYNPTGMTVWHGSPHVFSKFDLSKLGTGEGAQAYGQGMYMAQTPSVAQDYANKLTQVNGRAISDQLDSRIQYLNMLKQQAANGDSNAAKNIPVIEKSISELKNNGSLYKVDLPDTHIRRMLDWDEPIKNQPKNVRNFAKSLGIDMNDLGGDLLAQVGKDEAGRQALQKAGIPGIKYLDQQSRNASGWHITPPDQTVTGKWMVKSNDYNSKGMHFDSKEEAQKVLKDKLGEATRNFVVFDPNHLTILERNGEKLK